jgi:hypothetical protein
MKLLIRSGNTTISSISIDDKSFQELDVAKASGATGLPPIAFSIPKEPQFIEIAYNFKHKTETVKVLGIMVKVGEKEQPVSVAALTRSYYTEEVTEDDTKDKERVFVLSAYTNEDEKRDPFKLKPSEAVKLIAGKTVTPTTEKINVWVPVFSTDRTENGRRPIIGYKADVKTVYAVG